MKKNIYKTIFILIFILVLSNISYAKLLYQNKVTISSAFVLEDKYTNNFSSISKVESTNFLIGIINNVSEFSRFNVAVGYKNFKINNGLWKKKFSGYGGEIGYNQTLLRIPKFKILVTFNLFMNLYKYQYRDISYEIKNHYGLLYDTGTIKVEPLTYAYGTGLEFKTDYYTHNLKSGIDYKQSYIDYNLTQKDGSTNFSLKKLKNRRKIGMYIADEINLTPVWSAELSYHFIDNYYFKLNFTYR